ncbi:type IV pilin accessory protein [Acinetobacter seifertii]|uniref:Type IV pilin accessory protein n=2 Tax=Acinetobacter TaxID=469 RepID=A0A7H2VHH0_9GAMM|nr:MULTISPECIES: TfpX/TfpZ family type IV pilin accessory protein [Acinetobacter]ONN55500.1 type IV pilin accessory protein [Acinetobacter genomosp. 33YU]QNX12571.1 type IV pilin accessory protein [Acinetobacter seifertii]QNX19503.1 type IV pilin accessory protein [Acinetobacter seifertii]QNX26109.1 type IV pilin accessory protein [Acinetobacter seifertii]QNX37139.1 type IV pilin accessory protein [Acinetobacter seifertii]
MSKRFKFFLSHLSISIVVALIILIWFFLVWYPQPLAKAVGVIHIFIMLIAIDVILGPTLGFFVYKEAKKTLKFDLAVIILIQILALGYGLYSIAQGRPAWLVYNVDRFELVRNNEITDTNLQITKPQFWYPSWFNPQFAAVKVLKNKEERSKSMFEEIFSGISSAQRPELYVELVQVKPLIRNKVQNLNELEKFNSKQQVENILRKYPEANAWVPLKANAVDMVVLMDKNSAQVVKIVDLRPWK